MSKEWFQFVVAGAIVLVVVVLGTSDIKIPGSGLVASIIDAITDTISIEPAPAEPAPVLIEPVPAESTSTEVTPADAVPAEAEPTPTAEPVPIAPTGISSFQDILQVLLPPLSIENLVPAAPKGLSQLKVFVLAQDTLESAVNEWLAVQQNIAVDEINVDPYEGGAYLVVISYHAGGTSNTPTRLKLFGKENPEADANAFLSSLNPSQTVRSVAAVAGYYSWPEKTATIPMIFIIYE